MEKDEVSEFLRKMGMKDDDQQDQTPVSEQWDRVIVPESAYLIMGDRRQGKSALAYYLLETFSKKYNLLPASVGLPREKQNLLPSNFVVLVSPSDCANLENAMVFIDEAGLQLPIEDTKAREYVINFLSLPGHRNQILLLAFHFPKLVLMRYLPFFDAFLLKRPPYLLEFAGKRHNDALTQMMLRAEERFAELPSAEDVKRHTYVVAPRIRWQGMLQNPLCSFWGDELSRVWAGTQLDKPQLPKQQELVDKMLTMPRRLVTGKGWLADDPEMRTVYPVTVEMERRAKVIEEHPFQKSGYVVMEDGVTRIRWVKQVY